MTGQKDRYSTTEKLWKLDDKTLTTPEHDELVLKLLDKDYLTELVFKVVKTKNITVSDIKITEIISERPLTTSNGFIVGYADIFAYMSYNIQNLDDNGEPLISLQCPACRCGSGMVERSKLDNAIINKTILTCTSCDRTFQADQFTTRINKDYKQEKWIIECKPYISSFGETLRQLQTYRNTVYRQYSQHEMQFVIFTPDIKFKTAFESQGIRVISP